MKTDSFRSSVCTEFRERFSEDGAVILKDAIPQSFLAELHLDLRKLSQQIFVEKFVDGGLNSDFFVHYLGDQIDKDPQKFDLFCAAAGSLPSFLAISSHTPILNVIREFYAPNLLIASKGGLFFNKNDCSRRQYRWHQEISYFPNHDVGGHLWFPLYNDIQKTGGSLLIAKKSHKSTLEYSPQRENDAYLQNLVEIVESDYEILRCDVRLGDIVIFDHLAVHQTEPMTGNLPRVSGIARFVASSDTSMNFNLP